MNAIINMNHSERYQNELNASTATRTPFQRVKDALRVRKVSKPAEKPFWTRAATAALNDYHASVDPLDCASIPTPGAVDEREGDHLARFGW